VRTLRLATRGSPLARRQTELVSQLVQRAHPGLEVDPVVVHTRGDHEPATPLEQIGGQGVFVAEVEAAVVDGRADAAVHSAKDMPSTMPGHVVIGAVPRRADPRDALVGCALAALPAGGLVATGSVRRRAQLAYLRPDLVFTGLRGNMARRVAAADDGTVSAVVVALAAMERLGWSDRVTDVLDPIDVLPQAGQGAIAVQCRADDEATRALLAAIDHGPSHRALRAERAVLAGLGGSCAAPVGALAVPDTDADTYTDTDTGTLRLSGLLCSADGRTLVRRARVGGDPDRLGQQVAHDLLEGGGRAVESFATPAVSAALDAGS
jgi:hydroxymethylbilane synthase